MDTKHYDVFVIGSGIAGQTAAKKCAENNLKVAIADNREFGGTCSTRGCDPKKIILQFTDLLENANRLHDVGVKKIPKLSWKKIQKYKSNYTDSIPLSTEKKLTQLGIDLYHQSPEFLNENEIIVEGKKSPQLIL
jgi:glutathione reductase (NADPH)